MSMHAWPLSLEFSRSERVLRIKYDDEAEFMIPFGQLRLNSPSAEVQGHGSGPKPPPPVISDTLTIEKADRVGRYAVRLHFSDGHSSGLFTWTYLRELGEQQLN